MVAREDAVLEAIREAAKGLLFPSETDAPIEAWAWPGEGDPSPAALLAALGREPGTKVQEIGLDALFNPVASDEGDGPRMIALEDLLRRDLSELRVYRVGEVEIDVFVIGKTARGAWIGVRTMVVET